MWDVLGFERLRELSGYVGDGGLVEFEEDGVNTHWAMRVMKDSGWYRWMEG